MKNYNNYLVNKKTCLKSAKIKLQGSDYTSWQDAIYYETINPMTVHGSSPVGIGVYSFSLTPNFLQPTGSCPFDAIEDKYIRFILNNNSNEHEMYHIKIWSRCYNVLRITSGQVSVLY